jgi:hypothetical protein
MAYTLYVHPNGEEAFLMEVDALPSSQDTLIIGRHPRRRDNREVPYILSEVTTIIFPLQRINFIEVMPSGEDEEIYKPFRD